MKKNLISFKWNQKREISNRIADPLYESPNHFDELIDISKGTGSMFLQSHMTPFDNQGLARRKLQLKKIQGCKQRLIKKTCRESPSAFSDIRILTEIYKTNVK